jgi:AcrR family transcriptional regulator
VKLLEVARDALAASPTASLNSIAKAAGVGAGTLYRHFPTREALVLAVYRFEIGALVDSVPNLLAAYPPFEALRIWFERLGHDLRIKHGLGDALTPSSAEDVTRETYAPVVAAIDRLLRACKDVGIVRDDISGDELLLLMGFLSRTEQGKAGEEKAKRLIRVVLEGLRPSGQTPANSAAHPPRRRSS